MLLPVYFVQAGTILSTHKYAWSNQVGYINFANVTVSDSNLSGYAWSENTGWVKFNPAQGGVLNDGNGHLSGSAWGEGLGWISFSGVTISTSTGVFSGTATGAVVGTINFDCPNYCDVRTDWRQATSTATSTPVVTQTSYSSSGSRVGGVVGSTSHVESYNNPLVIYPQQSGLIQKETDAGLIKVEIPINGLLGKTTIYIDERALGNDNNYLVQGNRELVSNLFFDIYAIDDAGNYVHNFAKPLTITLPIFNTLKNYKNLKLYWLNETNWEWVLIPDAVFSSDKVVFTVDHLTKFAIFADNNVNVPVVNGPAQNIIIPLPPEKKPSYVPASPNNNPKTNIAPQASTTGATSTNGLGWIWVLAFLVLTILFFYIYLLRDRKRR